MLNESERKRKRERAVRGSGWSSKMQHSVTRHWRKRWKTDVRRNSSSSMGTKYIYLQYNSGESRERTEQQNGKCGWKSIHTRENWRRRNDFWAWTKNSCQTGFKCLSILLCCRAAALMWAGVRQALKCNLNRWAAIDDPAGPSEKSLNKCAS